MSDFTKLHRLERVDALNGASTNARAVWSLAHHALDRRGRMSLGGAEWRFVLARRLGIEPSARQWFYAGCRELESLGLAASEGDTFILVGHAGADVKSARQGRKHTSDTPTSDGPSTDLRSTSDGRIADVSRTFDQPKADLHSTYRGRIADLPHGTVENRSDHSPRARDQNREEESREEGEESRSETSRGRAPETAAAAAPNGSVSSACYERFERSFATGTDADRLVVELVSRTRQDAGGGPFSPVSWADRDAVSRLAEWGRRPEVGVDRVEVALRAFWAAKGTGARLSWLVDEDPGRYLGKPNRRSARATTATRAEHAAEVAAHGGEGRGHAIVEI